MTTTFSDQPPGYHYLLMAYPQPALEAALQELVRSWQLPLPAEGLGIALTSFMLPEEEEDTFRRWLHRLLGQQTALTLQLNNFGAILPDRLGVRIQEADSVRALQLNLKKLLLETKASALQFPLPRIAMTRALSLPRFDQLLREMSPAELHASLQLESIHLLKKQFSTDSYRPAGVFGLRPASQPLNQAI